MLEGKHCVPCSGGMEKLSRDACAPYLEEVSGWELNPDATAIIKRYTFKNFKQALAFVNQLGALAEEEGHHPDIAFGWGYAEITLQTHAIGGLHENDFVMAKMINAIFQ